jgi:glycosyltransferase involved in cell wall biosynthesis
LGGAEKYVGWVSKQWISAGNEVLIGIRECEQVESFYRSLDLPVRRINISGKLNPFAKSRVLSVINDFKPDVVHTHLSTASHWGLKAARAAGVKGVGHMHSFNSVGPYKNADRMIAVSNAVKIHLSANAFNDVDVVYPSSVVGQVAPAKDVVRLGDPVISCAARLREDKGIGVLADAFAVIQSEFPSAALAICGDGPMRSQLESRAKAEHLNIHCLGYRDDVPSVFAASAISVLPSIRAEGYGMSLYESQAVGTPVVTTTAGGTEEAMRHGETGVAVPPGSSEALARAIRTLLTNHDMRQEMSKNALAFAGSRSIEASAQALFAALSR